MSDDLEYLTKEQVLKMLPDGEYIHTFRGNGVLIGADWERKEILKFAAELIYSKIKEL